MIRPWSPSRLLDAIDAHRRDACRHLADGVQSQAVRHAVAAERLAFAFRDLTTKRWKECNG